MIVVLKIESYEIFLRIVIEYVWNSLFRLGGEILLGNGREISIDYLEILERV